MTELTLPALGWSNHFLAQLSGDPEDGAPARVSAITRDRLTVMSPQGTLGLTTPPDRSTGDFAVGDWVLTDGNRALRLLDRKTLLQRRAAGSENDRQLIAANVDTLAIVTSCNADFNIARLERYLALAAAAGCLPLVILTKADLTDSPQDFARAAERLSPLVAAIALDARDPGVADQLAPWSGKGQTLALLGSSGVGKTTLTNILTGLDRATQDIRDDDAKGRHTTTARALLPTLAGGWLIDTPGIRELGLTDAAEGIAQVFADLGDLAATCRFNDCTHGAEPGCAVQAAIAAGKIDAERLIRWQKLLREDARNGETSARARARGKSVTRHQARVQRGARQGKGEDG